MKETPAQMSFCEFYFIFNNIFLIEQFRVTASVTSYSTIFNLLYTFPDHLLLFKYFTKLNKFGIVGKLLPSGASIYTFL